MQPLRQRVTRTLTGLPGVHPFAVDLWILGSASPLAGAVAAVDLAKQSAHSLTADPGFFGDLAL